MPPLIYEDLVIIGPAGNEAIVKGWVGAFRLDTGEPVWRFDTFAGGTEARSETWSATDVITSGAAVWTPLSLDSPLPVDESLSGDWTADPAMLAGERLDRAFVRGALAKLTARQRSVVALYYFFDKSLYEIGRVLAISPQRASQLHVAALRNLRKVLHAAPLG